MLGAVVTYVIRVLVHADDTEASLVRSVSGGTAIAELKVEGALWER